MHQRQPPEVTMPTYARRVPLRCLVSGSLAALCVLVAVFAAVNPVNLVHDGTYLAAAVILCSALLAVTAAMLPQWPVKARVAGTTLFAALAMVLLLATSVLSALFRNGDPSVTSRDGPDGDGVRLVVLATAPAFGVDVTPKVALRRGHGPFAQESVVYVGPRDSDAPKARLLSGHRVAITLTKTCTLHTRYHPTTLRVDESRRFDHADLERCN